MNFYVELNYYIFGKFIGRYVSTLKDIGLTVDQ